MNVRLRNGGLAAHIVLVSGSAWFFSCEGLEVSGLNQEAAQGAVAASSLPSLIPEDRLQVIKAALPRVAYPQLQQVLESPRTIWYDHHVMSPSYQDSVGADINRNWPNRIAVGKTITESMVRTFFDRSTRRWQFPLATTAGTDRSDNLAVVNFLFLPEVDGQTLPIPIWKIRRNANRHSWMWRYPNGAVVGEVLFLRDGQNLLPAEIRIRMRYPEDWATNVFRPFPSAADLNAAIKARRPQWAQQPQLAKLVAHLGDDSTLVPLRRDSGALRGVFSQDGYQDPLPDFGDDALVRELLRETTFVSAWGRVWKGAGAQRSFAPTTASALSIVPRHYEAGIIEVSEQSCARCHAAAGKLLTDWQGSLYLYGEVWGKDGVFTFHPFDESKYHLLRRTGSGPGRVNDNRFMNPFLQRHGIVVDYDSRRHRPPHYHFQ